MHVYAHMHTELVHVYMDVHIYAYAYRAGPRVVCMVRGAGAGGGRSAADGGGSVVVLRSEAMEAVRPHLCWWSGTVRTAAWKMIYEVRIRARARD